MTRERTLKVVLTVVGLLFAAAALALAEPMTPNNAMEQMLASVYATLGVFLLLALRNPSANRSLIAFTAWSSLVHGAVMAAQVFRNAIPREDLLLAVLPLVIIGVALIILAPAKQSEMPASTARA